MAVAGVLIALVAVGSGAAFAQAGPLGSAVQQYGGSTRWPDVAYDTQHHLYLVVWGPVVIRGIFVNDDGVAVGSAFQISDSALYAQTPRAAFNPDTGAFLVVWHSSEGVATYSSGTRVRGRTVSYASGVSSSPTQVFSNATYTTRWEVGPAVAYSTASQRFLVAYNIFAATGAEVTARLADGAGNPIGSEIAVSTSSADYDREPAVGYFPSSNRFVVAWSASGTSADVIRARIFSAADGSAVGSTITLTQTTTTYVPEVSLNTSTGRMFVVWIQHDSATGGWRPFGCFIDDSGTILSSTTRLSSTVGSYDANSVAYNALTGSFFLVTHLQGTQQDMGFEITGAGSPVAAAAIVTTVTAANLTGSYNPRLATSSQESRWLIATAASFSSLWTQLIGGSGSGGSGSGGSGSGGGGGGSGGGSGTTNPQLTISPTPTGGTVTGGGLNCGTRGTTCQLTFTASASVTLTATADSGYTFTTWGGSCSGTGVSATVQVDAVMSCTATFTAPWSGAGTTPSGCLAAPPVVYASSPGPIGASVSQYAGATQYPDLAYDTCHQVYLSVWGSGGAIRGRFVNESGAGVGDTFDISTGNWAQRPRAVYNPNLGNFLVAWHSSASSSRTEVRSLIVTYPGGSAGAGTVLSASTYSSDSTSPPAIGYSTGSGHYLVAWSRNTSAGTDIAARLLEVSGAAVGTEFLVTSTSAESEREPGVAYFPASNRFLAAWAGTGTSTDFVRGQLYDASTGASYGSPIAIATGSFVHVPEVVLNSVSGRMFVAWMQYDSASSGCRPFGNLVLSDGTLASASVTRLSSTEGAFLANSVDFNPLSQTFFLVTHGSSTLQDVGFEISGTGTPLGSPATVTSITASGLTGSFYPQLAASQSQPRWLIGTAASSTSLWTQLVGGTQATSATTYRLNVTVPTGGTVAGGGISCGTIGTACSATFGATTSVTLTATPDSGNSFTSWGGSCSGTSTSTTVTVDGVKSCTATFTSSSGLPTGAPYTMTVSPVPAGGTITGAGLNCGTSGTACSVTMPAAMSLGLQAVPDSGYLFGAWSGHCAGTSAGVTVNLTGARTCSATFVPAGTVYRLTITAPTGGTVTGGGISCGTSGTTCSATYSSVTSVTLAATPDSGHSFTSWGGSCSGTGASTTVSVDGAKTCTAAFGTLATGGPYTMTISPPPTGGTVTGAGLNCGVGGSACSVTMPATMTLGLQATPATGYTFSGWSGNCSGTSAGIYVQLAGARTCGATFSSSSSPSTVYQLNVTTPTGGTVTGGGISCGTGATTCSATYSASASVTLTATPDTNYSFTGWGGSCSGASTSATVSVDGVKTCTATFGPLATGAPYTMTISPPPTGGTVTGAGLNCGVGGTACSVTMPATMTLGLQATAASGYTFAGWSGNCSGTNTGINVQLAGARTCSATFTSSSSPSTVYQLNVTTPTGGTVTGGGISCGTGATTCSATYSASTPVTLTATPDTNYSFTGWGGSCSGTGTSTTVSVDGVKTCTATFGPLATGAPYTMTISPPPTGGTITGAGLNCGVGGTACSVTMPATMTLGLQATAASGYTFAGWSGNCSGTNAGIFVQLAGARTCSAGFAAK